MYLCITIFECVEIPCMNVQVNVKISEIDFDKAVKRQNCS